MFDALPPDWRVCGLILFFIGIWLLVSCIISLTGGWFALSRIYRDANPPRAWQFTGQSIYLLGFGSYRQCIRGCVNPNGLHLSILFMFRVMHRPLFIPMAEIESVTLKKWLFFQRYQIKTRRTGVPIMLNGKFGEAVLREWEVARGGIPPGLSV